MSKIEFDERVDCMGSAKSIVSIIMSAVLGALCIIAVTCNLSISLKCFVIWGAVYGFFELYKWSKNK
jgi:hypothetical protein